VSTYPVALEREHLPAASRLLAAALADDPAYAAIFPAPATRMSALRRFFEGHLATHVPHRCSSVRLADHGAVLATVTVRPPGGIAAPPAALVRGLLSLALAHGARTIQRLLAVKEAYDELERDASEGRPHWHVHMMAVQPRLQGQGIGRALLDDALAITSTEAAPIVLTTHRAINVRFYERAGFAVVGERNVAPAKAAPYPVWSMRREA
jgi:ribosomal protein S18 acetylase RimI-like enzyme